MGVIDPSSKTTLLYTHTHIAINVLKYVNVCMYVCMYDKTHMSE